MADLPTGRKNHRSTSPAGYLVDHAINDAAIVMNGLLSQSKKIYWLSEGDDNQREKVCRRNNIPAISKVTESIVKRATTELGVNFTAVRRPQNQVR
ncbi:MAG: hypothetical protein R2727_08270 [Bacteroidales bacterium]